METFHPGNNNKKNWNIKCYHDCVDGFNSSKNQKVRGYFKKRAMALFMQFKKEDFPRLRTWKQSRKTARYQKE